jgi:hypothetical protein
MFERILVFSDMHFPYAHPDIIKFLTAVKLRFKPDKIVCLGDELDYHQLSFHDSSPELLGTNEEFIKAKRLLHGIVDLFPEMTILESNHGSLAYRRARCANLPAYFLKPYNEILEVPDTWKWVDRLVLDIQKNRKLIMHHGYASNAILAAKELCSCLVQGHYHSKMSINYFGDENKLMWAMQLPSLVNNKSMAFDYGKNVASRPKIGAGLILYGEPMLIPMQTSYDGKFIGLFEY